MIILKELFSHKGRIGRQRFAIIFLLAVFLNPLNFISLAQEGKKNNTYKALNYFLDNLNIFWRVALILISLILIYLIIVTCIKRFHDVSKSGYYTFLLFIPLFGFYPHYLLFFKKSNNSN